MASLNAQDVVANWSKGMVGKIQKVKDGVAAVTESPMAKAAARSDAYIAGVQRAVESGRYADGLNSVTLEEWKRLTMEKASRIQQGVKEAEPKMVQFFTQLLPYTAQVKREIAAMPKGTLADSIARSTAAIEKMAQFRFRKRKV